MNKYDVFNGAYILEKNPFFEIYRSDYSVYSYDQNFIQITKPIGLEKLKEIEQYYKPFVMNNCVVMKFHTDMILTESVYEYFRENGYTITYLELYMNKSRPNKTAHLPESSYSIVKVDDNFLLQFLNFKYCQDLEFGEKFAADNNETIRRLYYEEKLLSYISIVKDQVVGLINIIKNHNNDEIYDLYVKPDFRNKGIAKSLIFESFGDLNRDIIVVADKEDTPKKMYNRMGFDLITEWVEIQKEVNYHEK
ncbi:GNAT family N-acetyltransferase [Vagococcus lutrae]|uniref:GNAT family N-acetyltransferase n=1 Tax=Vagococcus lutrae TaxID=81947 RepID=UPI001C98C2DB|nr:GNAT family N-acetyltransferase [Vagococcus lutrae]MDT2818042.1 GNAT family N-acetyltransferase [Vagococcus lutrae]QZN88502.1 GNAT family N-acetyltransferase [Vagococcus lutrae]